MKDLEMQVLNLKDLYEETVKERNLVQEENQRLRQMLADHGISYTSNARRIKHETSSSDSFSGSFRTPSSASGTLSPLPSQEYGPRNHMPSAEPGFDHGRAGIDFVVAYDKHRTPSLPYRPS